VSIAMKTGGAFNSRTKPAAMESQRIMELHWQIDVLQQWLGSALTPADARPQLYKILTDVKSQLNDLKRKQSSE